MFFNLLFTELQFHTKLELQKACLVFVFFAGCEVHVVSETSNIKKKFQMDAIGDTCTMPKCLFLSNDNFTVSVKCEISNIYQAAPSENEALYLPQASHL